jgi:integration host factor subunit beta
MWASYSASPPTRLADSDAPALLDDRGWTLRPLSELEGEIMIRSELILRLAAQNSHLYNRDVEKVVNTIFDGIAAALARGERVELRGFGIFTLKTRSARPGRNPKTGALISVPETHHPSFRTGKEMHARLNGTLGSAPRAAFHKS